MPGIRRNAGIRRIAREPIDWLEPGVREEESHLRDKEEPVAMRLDALNPQTADLDLLPAHLRTLVLGSELLRRASEKVPVLTTVADSVNVRSVPRRA